ncbi:MAG: beta-N-acetylhexosaminidase, partial [Clostridia bacterium]|nr:beta-N-acetylhexosaminidase [Clostridia bacterium]
MRKFKILCAMLDMSRNAVMKPQKVKEYIDYLSLFGYNALMLYTEDTYEIKNHPKFGYLRGKYSESELKEIDAYAVEKGIELIPCIQTLGHLERPIRWPEFWRISDIDDILLVDDDETYKLIDDMFCALERCFTSRTVNIGLDEAHRLGRGKYLDRHGYENRSEIFLKHLNKVVDIAKKHGFKPLCWGDMLFSMNEMRDYYKPDAVKDFKYKNLVPDNLSLVYWDYYHTDKEFYDKMIEGHRKISDKVWVAGGVWTWNGFAPFTKAAMSVIRPCVESARDKNVDEIIITVWGNGAECSYYSGLAALFYAAQVAQGNENIDDIKKIFYNAVGISYDRFLDLELPNCVSE